MICALLYNIHYLVDQRVFNYAMNKQDKGGIRVAHWGVYYGKYSVVTGIVAIICTMSAVLVIPRIAQMYDKQEYGEVKYRIGSAIHNRGIWLKRGNKGRSYCLSAKYGNSIYKRRYS